MKIAVVCSSNNNRSMEAHYLLSKKGFQVKSFGTGSVIKLPGLSVDQPNVYQFGTSYEQMYQDLLEKEPNYYTQNGILRMLDRNRRMKEKPEKFQDSPDVFDLIITVEERIYDSVVEDFQSRAVSSSIPAHVINIEIKDNHEDATLGAFLIYELCQMLRESSDVENDIEDVIQEFEYKHTRTILHTPVFY
ncbi:RNA polymerase II subunit A C-terminal domain phosphatase SSU72-like [Dysidea avara]|uniref:RNA polymerase II subunit A C-terminal domain phosphatase SSU72-like n=1 Tax=Dysidea avara TaxID=196820 RepID=UPI00331D3E97